LALFLIATYGHGLNVHPLEAGRKTMAQHTKESFKAIMKRQIRVWGTANGAVE
jgi:hypothetical protein